MRVASLVYQLSIQEAEDLVRRVWLNCERYRVPSPTLRTGKSNGRTIEVCFVCRSDRDAEVIKREGEVRRLVPSGA